MQMATSQNNNAWFVYDHRVRMDRQIRGLPWEVFNVEFFIMATRARDCNFSGTFVNRDKHFSIMEATVPYEVPFALPTEGIGIVETLEEHLEIINLEVDTLEDYVGPLTGMDFAKSPTADSLTNVHNVERNIQCSSACHDLMLT